MTHDLVELNILCEVARYLGGYARENIFEVKMPMISFIMQIKWIVNYCVMLIDCAH